MANPAARFDDELSDGSMIANGSPNVFINSKNAARVEDPTTEGNVLVVGSNTVFVNGRPLAMQGRTVDSDGNMVVEASPNVFVG